MLDLIEYKLSVDEACVSCGGKLDFSPLAIKEFDFQPRFTLLNLSCACCLRVLQSLGGLDKTIYLRNYLERLQMS